MKQKIKRHYRSAISVLLSVCMLISCMTVGLIATDAAKVTGDEAVAAQLSDGDEAVAAQLSDGDEAVAAQLSDGDEAVGVQVSDDETVGDSTHYLYKGISDTSLTQVGALPLTSVSLSAGNNYINVTRSTSGWNKDYVWYSSRKPSWDITGATAGAINWVQERENGGCYYILINTAAAGTFNFSYSDGKLTITGGTAPSTTWNVTGDSTAIFTSAWDNSLSVNTMTETSTNEFTWTKSNVYLEAGAIKYKVTNKGSWNPCYPSGDSSQKKTVGSSGYYNVEIVYNSSPQSLEMNLTSAGSYNLTLPPVDNAEVQATYNGVTITEGGTLEDIPQGASVSITVTPDTTKKKCNGITSSTVSSNGGSINGSGTSWTLTMPGADVDDLVFEIGNIGTRTVYYYNYYTKYAMVSAYVSYNDSAEEPLGAWAGSTMKREPNTNYWSIEVPEDVHNIYFIGDGGVNSGSMNLQTQFTDYPSPKIPMYTGKGDAPTIANGSKWGEYVKPSNIYSVSMGSQTEGVSLFTGIKATFYDYYVDNEITGGWLTGIKDLRDYKCWGKNENDPFTSLNSALSSYAADNSITYPLYFGNLKTSTYTSFHLNANNSTQLSPNSTSILGLAGNKLAKSTIHHYKSDGTDKNGAAMALFDDDFLSGQNSQQVALATILRSSAFPVQKKTGGSGDNTYNYYEFDSTNGVDNAYITNINSDTQTAQIDYYKDNPYVQSEATDPGKVKGFYPFDYNDKLKKYKVTYVYFKPNSHSEWSADNARFAAYFYGGGLGEQWMSMEANSDVGSGYYRCRVPDNATEETKVIFCRMKGSDPTNNWGNKWNQTGDLTCPYDSNYVIYTVPSGSAGDSKDYNDGVWNWSTHSNISIEKVDSNASNASKFAHDLGFGVKLEIPFTLRKDGLNPDGNAQTFEFSGDDDLWVYIDDELILDMGGAHAKSTGNINFNTKKATIDKGAAMSDDTSVTGSQQEKTFNIGTEEDDVNVPHTMTIYYMERGMFESNLHFSFSFDPIPNQFKAEKKVRTANINSGFYNDNEQTGAASNKNEYYSEREGRFISKFEGTYQTENFEFIHSYHGDDPTQYILNKTPYSVSPSGKSLSYTLQNDNIAYFVKQFSKNDTFTLKEVPAAGNKYNYTPSLTIYDETQLDDKGDPLTFTEVSGSPGVGEVSGNNTDGYIFKFSETNPIVGIDNLNIRARFSNQMKSHDLILKKEIDDPIDVTSTFTFQILFDFDGTYIAYPLNCTVDGATRTLDGQGKITVKAGEQIILPKIPENAKIKITELITEDNSDYNFSSTTVKHTDGSELSEDSHLTPITKGITFSMGTKDINAKFINNKRKLIMSHTLHPDSVEGAEATCKIAARVLNGDTPVENGTYEESVFPISLDPSFIKSTSTYTLEITISTTVADTENYLLEHFYDKIDSSFRQLSNLSTPFTVDPIEEETAPLIAVIKVPIASLFTDGAQNYTSLPFYSKLEDAFKPVNYRITYVYSSRRQYVGSTTGSLYGNQTYTKEGVLTKEITGYKGFFDPTANEGDGAITKAFVKFLPKPTESNFMENLLWSNDDAKITDLSVDKGSPATEDRSKWVYTATYTATPEETTTKHVKFLFPYQTTKVDYPESTLCNVVYIPTDYNNPVADPAPEAKEAIEVQYQGEVVASKEIDGELYYFHTTAPSTFNGQSFNYWSIKAKNRYTDEYDEVARSYEETFKYTIFDDYLIEPIYGETGDDASTSTAKYAKLNLLEITRNQWNKDGHGSQNPNKTKDVDSTARHGLDTVYVDFDLAYAWNDKLLSKNSKSLETGLLIQDCGIEVDADHKLNIAGNKSVYQVDVAYYQDRINTLEDNGTLKNADDISNSVSANPLACGENGTAKLPVEELSLTRYAVGKILTNKNRIELGVTNEVREIENSAEDVLEGWSVDDAKKTHVFRAYAYLRDARTNATTPVVYMSEPVLFTLKNVAELGL